ncbi:hypothetical protein J2W14_003881 [Pseudarthrobacter oxydans]|uniref:hypothetical protein n=1 Tax=Pseudarthrobacter oxydans TaxID=1671 RepID=UPI00278A15F5|nr:hypothetical protein [Pseudarthrobacter oxydans]MDP9984456.1 hypothetical protein [Pseudarthrobacter oxydans]
MDTALAGDHSPLQPMNLRPNRPQGLTDVDDPDELGELRPGVRSPRTHRRHPPPAPGGTG